VSQRSDRRSTCPVACTLDLIGDRWTLLIVRDLLGGKRTFDAFLESPERIATNVLADRLARLEGEGLVERASDADDGRRFIYRLTERGRGLGAVMRVMRDWGLEHLAGTSLEHFEAMRRGAKVESSPARRRSSGKAR
jgi:DNA-binding HxlR family transcriptional regulator